MARYALETANPSRSYGLEEAHELCAFAAGGAGGDLPGLAMERLAAKVVLSNRAGARGARGARVPSVDSLELQLDSSWHGRGAAWRVGGDRRRADANAGDPLITGRGTVVVDARELGAHLIVRHRRPGDRLQPLGAPGRKKVQDVLVDRKVPRDDRDRVPIVTTEQGEIVWVAGEVLAEPVSGDPAHNDRGSLDPEAL